MSIMDLFKAAPAATNANKAPADKPPESSKTGDVQSANEANNLKKDTQNPFDGYQKMFDNAATNSDIQAPSFSLDPKVIADVSSKMNFTQGINPELVQKATDGDAASMIQLIQEVGRNAYRASLEHTTKLTDTHLGQRSEYEGKKLRSGVREQLTNEALSTNPNYNHPVIKSELNRIAKQFAGSNEYADASPQQIADAARQYLNDLHSAMNPADPSKTKEGKPKAKEIDYMQYLTGTDSE